MKLLSTGLLLGGLVVLAGPARAEDITISTYYPSPRGVYQELRTTNNTYLATQAGSVGVGTTDPSAGVFTGQTVTGLQVSKAGTVNLSVRDSTDAVELLNYAYSGGGLIGTATNHDLSIRTNNANRITVLAAGNVGIGTTNPAAGYSAVAKTLQIGDGTNQHVAFKMVEDQGSLEIVGDTNRWYFKNGTTPASAFTPILTLDNANGNVGIGTTGPTVPLDIRGFGSDGASQAGINIAQQFNGSGVTMLRVRNTGLGGSSTYVKIGTNDVTDTLSLEVYNSSHPTLPDYAYIRQNKAAPLILETNNNANQLVLASSGNVGIGTTGPGSLLDVRGANSTPIMINTANSTADGSLIRLAEAGSFLGAYIRYDSLANRLDLGRHNVNDSAVANDSPVISIDRASGSVGIGMTPGADRLGVSGDIRASGNVFAGSDVRFKQAIQPLTNVLGKLDQVQAVSFERSALAQALGQPARGREIGVIGQELEQVFPELVSASGPERYRAVEYGKLTVVLLEAIKELKQQDAEAINALKAKQAALQARLDALEKAQQQR